MLTPSAIDALQRRRMETLKTIGRVEFGEGILFKLVMAFRDSPYLNAQDYEQTLGELQELFYALKNECRELLTDDELIDAMRLVYNDVAHGSTEYLSGVEWKTLYRIGRSGSLRGSGLQREEPAFGEDE